MSITAFRLYRDSGYFFRHHTSMILLLALLTSLITVLLHQLFGPSAEQLKLLSAAMPVSNELDLKQSIEQLNLEQYRILLQELSALAFSAFIGNLLLTGSILTLIRLSSAGQSVSALRAMAFSLPQLPGLLLLQLISALLIPLGLSIFIIPGLIIMISLSLSPAIYFAEGKGVFNAIQLSCKMAFANVSFIISGLMLWLAAQLLLLLLAMWVMILTPDVSRVIFTAIGNVISALLLIYFSRLYMLTKQ
ncbi:YciC family protein [Serratia microhaemolytica]|uniref:YciC family protein n=1 Tax=Serratia microhaemolytica TaxID=2675110 RepID=UPI000FDCE7DE|nr:YciC family protein [Serratia microhaemolytica]